jgi:hypothetical protein
LNQSSLIGNGKDAELKFLQMPILLKALPVVRHSSLFAGRLIPELTRELMLFKE